MWIMLHKKIPCEVSPPIGSIHWSGASAADLNTVHHQHKMTKEAFTARMFGGRNLGRFDEFVKPLDDHGDMYFDGFGYEPKEELSRWILFDSEPVKVWAHEFTQVSDENLEIYLNGTETDFYSMSHVPMYNREHLYVHPIHMTIVDEFDKFPEFTRDVYEAALVDGANPLQAFYTSVGRFPRSLWYAMLSNYGSIMGYDTSDLYPVFRKKGEVFEQIKQGWKEDAL